MVLVRTLMVPAVLGACALVLTGPAQAATTAQKEVSLAESHAEDAADSSDLPNVRMHLHHVINCLVGPKGNGFDVTVANPCVGLGTGAVADTEDPKKRDQLVDAVVTAKDALRAPTVEDARKQATDLERELQQALGVNP